MEELRLLVEMVADLPHMALWVVAAFFVYKVIVVGSIYGVIRFVAAGLFIVAKDWIAQGPATKIIRTKEGFDFVNEDAIDQMKGLMRKVSTDENSGVYFRSQIFPSDISELKKAWEFYLDEKKKQKKESDEYWAELKKKSQESEGEQ